LFFSLFDKCSAARLYNTGDAGCNEGELSESEALKRKGSTWKYNDHVAIERASTLL
jgi:hypothetical protein